MKKAVCACLAAVWMLVEGPAAGARSPWGPADRDYLVRAMAANYGEETYAAQVGIAAVVLRRMGTAGYPDSAAGVIEGLRAEGEFTKYPACSRVGEDSPDDSRTLRIASDAVRDALRGADPAEGFLSFRTVRPRRGFDLRFDDAREDESARQTLISLSECEVIIGNAGFW